MMGEGGEEQRGGLGKGSFTLTSMELGCAAGHEAFRGWGGRALRLSNLMAVMVGGAHRSGSAS